MTAEPAPQEPSKAPRKRRRRSKIAVLTGPVSLRDDPTRGWPGPLRSPIYAADVEDARAALQEYLQEVTDDPEATVDPWKWTSSQSKRLSRGELFSAPISARAEGKFVILWTNVCRWEQEANQ